MGSEFLCVAAGSPWMTDPVVYMMGDPSKPPLSEVPAKAREDLQLNGRRIFNGMQKGRGMSEQQFQAFIKEHSIEANADEIVIPTLFLTSRGDDQAPHALIEPMIERMKDAKKYVQVYTAEKALTDSIGHERSALLAICGERNRKKRKSKRRRLAIP
jgi:hypothetical protein